MLYNNLKILLVILFLFRFPFAHAQSINLNIESSDFTHSVNANAGLNYGLVFGLGYCYKLPSKIPIYLHTDISVPAGEVKLDDYKIKLGGTIDIYEINNFHVSFTGNGIFRRYETTFVRMLNFGSDFSVKTGYYKPKWMVAAEFGFDKAIVTNIRNGDAYLEMYPFAQDGWYEPATGGNFYYDVQAGYSFGQHDIYVIAGKMISQDFKTTPIFPMYAQLGYNFRW